MKEIEKKGDIDLCSQDAQKSCRTHRVGTITCGLVLVLYGILFLVRMVAPILDYKMIFDLWPVILILLGIEILAGTALEKHGKQRFIYDFASVLIIIMMMAFSMIMAVADLGMRYGGIYCGI
ncbi:MAG: DUF5668 domain-containing protein [Blautia sp.]|nr:DUF5668 domain-containing protein [Lachnoclostridium sp.]MCM1211876.1 DUF5668 domain-containing protein [Blautia sp.]